jgi:signal transduction histidine kinase
MDPRAPIDFQAEETHMEQTPTSSSTLSSVWSAFTPGRPAAAQRYQDIVQTAPAILYEYSLRACRTTWVSPGAEQLTGWPVECWTGTEELWEQLLHPDDRHRVARALDEAARTGRVEMEYRLRHSDNAYRWYRDIGTVMAGPDGPLLRGLAVDVTEQHRVTERERAYATLVLALTRSLDTGEVLVHIADTAGRLLAATWAAVFVPDDDGTHLLHGSQSGTTALPLLSVPLDDTTSMLVQSFREQRIVCVTDYSSLNAPAAALLRGNQAGPAATLPVVVDGRAIAVLAISRRAGEPPFTGRDLEDAQHLAAQAGLALVNAQRYTDAKAASDAKSAFLSTMCHELRTPLNAVDGFLSLLEMEIRGSLSDEQRDYVRRARRAGRHLLHIVEDLFDLARIERGRITVEQARFDAGDPLRQAAEIVRPQIRGAHVRLLIDETATGAVALGDPDRVRQILINLLGNAAKFTEQGEIRIAMELDDATVRYVVSDTGPGIAAAQLGRIFEPFYQVDGRLSRANTGAGLGLAVSRSLARAMGGDLAATSTIGSGSVFTLTLARVE